MKYIHNYSMVLNLLIISSLIFKKYVIIYIKEAIVVSGLYVWIN
jgi:hypothetical protein